MADAITTILRRNGEAPDPALQRCLLAQGFARLILDLASLQRAEARVFALSLAEPEHGAWLAEVEVLRDECAERLALLSDPPVEFEASSAPLVQAARLMQRWLAARSTHPDEVGAPWLSREATRMMPRGESRLSWQTGLLVRKGLGLFAEVTGLNAVPREYWAAPCEVEAALPELGWVDRDRDVVGLPAKSIAVALFPGALRAGAAA